MKQFILIVLGGTFLLACSQKTCQEAPDVSDLVVDLSIERFEQKLFELSTKGATKEQIAQAAAAIDVVDNFKKQQEAMEKNIQQR